MEQSGKVVLSLEKVLYSVVGKRILSDVSIDVTCGTWVAVLGPNGSGKSTLLRVLAGLLPPTAGRVRLHGKDLSEWSRRERAQKLAFLPQRTDLSFPFAVRDIVAMGRVPHLARWQSESRADRQAVDDAMLMTQISDIASRNVLTLSGGEYQRVMLARVIAQEADILLLDEPNTALDLQHQFILMDLLESLVGRGTTVVTVLHDPNLAANKCDSLILLDGGSVYASGIPSQVLTIEAFRSVFGVEAVLTENSTTGGCQIVPIRSVATVAQGPKVGHIEDASDQ